MREKQENFDVVVVGNIGIDTNVYLPSPEIDWSIESNFTENLDYIGQAGGYSARGFAQLGYKTALIGSVGDDFSGKYILEELEKDHVNTEGVFIDPAGTNRSVNFVFPDGTRKNFYDGKGHMSIKPDLQICESILRMTKVVHFSLPNWARLLLPLAEKLGSTISCDLQDIIDIEDEYRRDFIHSADILFFSSVNQDSPIEMMDRILEKYPEKILISGLGKKGCALGTKQGVEFFEPFAMDRAVIDTNGAGDGLAVGFLSAYCLDHLSLQDSITQAQIAARYTCAIKASTSNLLTRSLLDHFLERNQV